MNPETFLVSAIVGIFIIYLIASVVTAIDLAIEKREEQDYE